MNSEIKGFPGEMAILLGYPLQLSLEKVSFDCIMNILFDLWFPLPNFCFAAACIFNSGDEPRRFWV